ncbi:MAG: iron response transcriptional regulator IrrA [Alphaproteobacteria bacterium]
MSNQTHSDVIDRLRAAKLRPTRQRIALAELLFGDGSDRHITAELLHEDVLRTGTRVSLATVYNTLHQFTDAGLLRQIMVDSGKTYFDTNTDDHHHFLDASNSMLIDIPEGEITVANLPQAPEGRRIARVDVVIRLEDE